MLDELVSWGRAPRDVRHAKSNRLADLDAIIIRTRVKASERTRYRSQLDAVYDGLRAARPTNYRSLTFQIGDDDAEYVDIALGPELPGLVGELASFQDFRTGLEDRCDARTTDTISFCMPTASGDRPRVTGLVEQPACLMREARQHERH